MSGVRCLPFVLRSNQLTQHVRLHRLALHLGNPIVDVFALGLFLLSMSDQNVPGRVKYNLALSTARTPVSPEICAARTPAHQWWPCVGSPYNLPNPKTPFSYPFCTFAASSTSSDSTSRQSAISCSIPMVIFRTWLLHTGSPVRLAVTRCLQGFRRVKSSNKQQILAECHHS